jgi:hypothetical protein
MADNAANRLVIAITGDTSQIEQQLRGLESRAAKIMSRAAARGGSAAGGAAAAGGVGDDPVWSTNKDGKSVTTWPKEAAAATAQLTAQTQTLTSALTQEAEATLRVAGARTAARGAAASLDPQAAAGLAGVSTRLANIRRESKAVGMEMYRNIGNPFLVVSSISQRITGFYQMSRDSEQLGMRMERVNDLMRRAAAQGRSMTVKSLLDEFTRIGLQIDKNNKKMKGPGFVARGIADFGINQFLTAGLFGIFQLNTLALQAIMTPIIEGATKMFRELFDKAGLAKERMLALASAVEKAGGAAGYASQLGAAPGSAAEQIGAQAELFKRQGEYVKGFQDYIEFYRNREDNAAASAVQMQQATNSLIAKAQADYMVNRNQAGLSASLAGATNESIYVQEAVGTMKDFFSSISPEAASKFTSLVSATDQSAMTFGKLRTAIQQVVDGLFQASDGLDKQRAQIQGTMAKFQAQQQLDQLERERWSLTGSMEGIDRTSGADKWFMAAANAARQQERWQKAAAAYSQQLTRRQQRQTLGQAAADVTRAGIGRPGQSGFELAAAVLEARARAQEARQQIDIQRKQEAIQRKIEYWGSVQANADRQQRILANAVALGMQQAQMVLTVDPASGQLLARFVASDVWKMISGAIANNTPTPTSTGGRTGRRE